MSPLARLDGALDDIIRELTFRIVVARLYEFQQVWEIANDVCDRYEVGPNHC